MPFTAQDVKALREKTGVGMMDCKKALTEADGDMEKAIIVLREKGLAGAQKKAGRIASQGIVDSYIHFNGKVGVLIEVNCETDFVAMSDTFKQFVRNCAMQVAAMKPTYVSKEEVKNDELEQEKEILRTQALNEPKPKPLPIIEKMIEGRINKYYKEVCLLEQDYVKDSSKTIQQYLNETIAQIGEKISIRRFVRYEMGEGLEQRKDDFVGEVMGQVAKMQEGK